MTRKVLRDGGEAARGYIQEIRRDIAALDGGALGRAARLPKRLGQAVDALEEATEWLRQTGVKDQAAALAGAAPYLRLFGTVAGGAMMAKAAGVAAARLAAAPDDKFYRTKLATAAFYGDHILPQAQPLADTVINGADSALSLEADDF